MGLAVALRCENARDWFVDGATQWALLREVEVELGVGVEF
jgi:hypothetical protein